jgi:hypothetical protein
VTLEEQVVEKQEQLVASNQRIVEAFDSGLISYAGDGPVLSEEETAANHARAVQRLRKSEEDLEEIKRMYGLN